MLIEFVFRNCVFKLKVGIKDKNFVGLYVDFIIVYKLLSKKIWFIILVKIGDLVFKVNSNIWWKSF